MELNGPIGVSGAMINASRAVHTTEVRILDEDALSEKLTDMRVWLDQQRYEPSRFTYFFHCPGMTIHVSFKSADQAGAFARKFHGSVLGSRWAPDPGESSSG